MLVSEWIFWAKALKAAHGKFSGASEAVLRRALVELHQLVCQAPNEILEKFRTIDEEQLQIAADAQEDRIAAGHFEWRRALPVDEQDWIFAVGTQIRALDHALLTFAPAHFGRPSDPTEWLCPSANTFVIPRKHPRHPSGARNDRDYKRRGLRHHRILPREIGGCEIVLVWHDTIPPKPPRATDPIVVGAALFQELELDIERHDPGRFIVTGARCRDPDQTITSQIEAAHADACSYVLWPELTVPPALRGLIARRLRERSLSADPRPSPEVIVAGTWHEAKKGGGTVNLLTVLDGYGSTRLTYEKMLAFQDANLGAEDIQTGTKLPVLVTDDQLIAFAVCRDFCDLSYDLPYPELDVDLVFVPSMGGPSTMVGHQITAKVMRVRYEARTYVVQQAYPGEPDSPLGLVLPMPNDPAPPSAVLQQHDIWQSYQYLR